MNILEIPEEITEEVIHLIRYALCEQRSSNKAWIILNEFCEKHTKIKLTSEEFLMYSITHNNNK